MKQERIKIFFVSLTFCFLFSLGSFFLTQKQYKQYKKNVNEYVYGILSIIKEKYPSIPEEELIKLVNHRETIEYLDMFQKYGIEKESSILYNMEKNYQLHLFYNIGFTALVLIVFLSLFYFYYRKKEHNIEEIIHYMKEINHKNYLLAITDNGEGSLSILKNEVYKMTIMLREESENLRLEKLALKDSISDISHQLKTPLTSILIMLDNIIDNPNMEEITKAEFIKNVQHQVETIHFLIVSLLKISRFDADVVEFKKEPILIEKLITHAFQNVSILNQEKKVNLTLEGDKKTSFVGDYHWELEAITNILKNAIEHSKEKGNVQINVFDNALYTKISITDDGIGMSKKDLQNIFKRFYKGENSKNDSIGIGLSLAKKIIEKDNGLIKVNSKKEMGTTFEIRYMK